MRQMLGQLIFHSAKNRWPRLTKHQFEVAAQAVVDRHSDTKRVTMSLLVAELEIELEVRHGKTSRAKKK